MILEPLSFGAVQSITTLRPDIAVIGASGSSGVYAASTETGSEKLLNPKAVLALTLNV